MAPRETFSRSMIVVTEEMGVGAVAGWTGGSSASSARASPYPSPSASPRPGYGALPPQDLGLAGLAGPGMGGMGMSMGGVGLGMPGSLSGQMGMAPAGMAPPPMNGQIPVTRRQGVLEVDSQVDGVFRVPVPVRH